MSTLPSFTALLMSLLSAVMKFNVHRHLQSASTYMYVGKQLPGIVKHNRNYIAINHDQAVYLRKSLRYIYVYVARLMVLHRSF